MPPVETPPNSVPPTTPAKVRTGRFGELEEHELIHLLDSLDDERSRARFRESVYISLIVYLALAWFLFYGPRLLFHQPRVIDPMAVLKERDKNITYLNTPKDLSKTLSQKPVKTPKSTIDQKTLKQLQAMEKARVPAPAPPAPAAQQPAPQQAKQAPPPPPLPQHPQQQAIVDAPKPAPTRPNFGNPNQSAGEAIRSAAQAAAQNRGDGSDVGTGIPVAHQGLNTGVDILSDTMGVDFNPYLKRIIYEIYHTWLPLIPEEARPPLNKQGETLIRFTILPDGRIGGMTLDGSTHDQAIDRAAWGSITGVGQFPALPKEFHGPNLELRIHYLVNKNPPE
ncbi:MULTISPECIES: TonB family protein [Acidobacteriaceae]|uniref:TonB family protein n=1 Tax=Acidobacteriaceae TaxID=204434 RepID=UPI00131D89EB|nr:MULTISPECIES: TonB family protein [Acidobacteriaceae]MDW5267626.1 TonB family protein [Edaphobacter sp.]